MLKNRTYNLNTSNDDNPIHLILSEIDFIHIQDLIECLTDANSSLPERHLKFVQWALSESIKKREKVDEIVDHYLEAGNYFARLLLRLQQCQPMILSLSVPLSRIEF